jgi:hypothetical protein
MTKGAGWFFDGTIKQKDGFVYEPTTCVSMELRWPGGKQIMKVLARDQRLHKEIIIDTAVREYLGLPAITGEEMSLLDSPPLISAYQRIQFKRTARRMPADALKREIAALKTQEPTPEVDWRIKQLEDNLDFRTHFKWPSNFVHAQANFDIKVDENFQNWLQRPVKVLCFRLTPLTRLALRVASLDSGVGASWIVSNAMLRKYKIQGLENYLVHEGFLAGVRHADKINTRPQYVHLGGWDVGRQLPTGRKTWLPPAQSAPKTGRENTV